MKNKEKYDIRYMTFNVSQNKDGTVKSIDIYYDLKRIKKMKFLSETSATQAMNVIGEWLEEEYKLAILTDKEEAYLSAIINPFRKDVNSITKKENNEGYEWLRIMVEDNNPIVLPGFEKGTMYKGMTSNTDYTIEELGL